ncbi:MAG: heavy-metal-associated domain-containing protein [Chloroflexota bacterium]|nr:heavy-metal-associated domain-containing protein [Chloroflexota bacterium]
MNTVTYTVPNISCKHCTHTISMELSDLDGVSNVDADPETKKVTVQFDAPASEETIKDTLAEINYPAEE